MEDLGSTTLEARAADYSSYNPAYFAQLFTIEDHHFWFRTRNKVIANLVRETVADLAPGYHVLEVGCGTGNVLQVLEQICWEGIVTGTDLFSKGLHYAGMRTTSGLVQCDIHTPPFSRQFELIGLFDVLEHLPDDVDVLRTLHSMLTPRGALLLTVPAHQSLWSYFDEAGHHCRRYELPELEQKLQQAGYHVEYLSHYMASIFPLVWLGRRLASWIGGHRAGSDSTDTLASGELRIIPIVNHFLTFILSLEAWLLARRHRMFVGTSLLAIARAQ